METDSHTLLITQYNNKFPFDLTSSLDQIKNAIEYLAKQQITTVETVIVENNNYDFRIKQFEQWRDVQD